MLQDHKLPGDGVTRPRSPEVGQPEAGLVVPLVEVQGGHELHKGLTVVLSVQEGLDVVVEPGLVPESPGVHLGRFHLLLGHKVARHDNCCVQ